MKKYKIIFWITTSLIFVLEGLLPAFTSQSEMAKEGIRHLGYPEYFGTLLAVFKTLGGFALILPLVPKRVKEWAYAGYGFDFIAAFVSIAVVDGMSGMLFLPVVAMAILVMSYVTSNKLNA